MGEKLLPLLHERLTCVGILTLKTQFSGRFMDALNSQYLNGPALILA